MPYGHQPEQTPGARCVGARVDRELLTRHARRPAFLCVQVCACPRALPDRAAHFAHRAFQTDEDGARDDVVPDVELAYLADGGDRADVARGEAVAGGDLQTRLRGEDCRLL